MATAENPTVYELALAQFNELRIVNLETFPKNKTKQKKKACVPSTKLIKNLIGIN